MIKVKKLDPEAILPEKKLESAGYDIYTLESRTLPARERITVRTGIAVEIPPGYVTRLCDRSSMAKCGIHVIAGVIDADYRGEILVMLQSLVNYDIEIVKQTRIAQALVHQVANFDVVEVEELSETVRGAGGFGSTGK